MLHRLYLQLSGILVIAANLHDSLREGLSTEVPEMTSEQRGYPASYIVADALTRCVPCRSISATDS